MLSASTLLSLSLLASTHAFGIVPGRRTHLRNLHESRDAAPHGFVATGAPAPDSQIHVRLALVQDNPSALHDALYAISTPGHELYGQFLSKDEAAQLVAPKAQTTAAVQQWLAANGLSGQALSPAGDWLGFNTTVAHANALFGADYNVYTHLDTGAASVQTLGYALPAVLQGHVAVVHPGATFPNPYTQAARIAAPLPAAAVEADAAQSCAQAMTPKCVQQLYGLPTAPATQAKNAIGVSGFVGQYADSTDLKSFLTKFRPDLAGNANATFDVLALDGGINPQGAAAAGVEASLDIQYTVGLANGVPTKFLTVGNHTQDNGLGGFLDMVNYLLAQDDIPQVLTTSYSMDEKDIAPALATNLCNAYAQLGARGVSILFSSGDGGVAGSHSKQTCTTFVPTFPSGCPYITVVGATAGAPTETAADFSSSGFSNIFPVPDFQKGAMSAYLGKIGSTNQGLYNAGGRGFPDVSATGEQIPIVSGGQTQAVQGTSASTPIFASVVALLNDRRLAAGQQPLGWLNPWLYNNTAMLNDITSGNNAGCNTPHGFPAVPGWDAVTGLGTPNWAKMAQAAGVSA